MAHHDHSKQEGDQELQREIGLISSEESELEILAAYDADQLSLQDPSLQLREQIRTTAANTFRKDRRINIRLSDHDLVGIENSCRKRDSISVSYIRTNSSIC